MEKVFEVFMFGEVVLEKKLAKTISHVYPNFHMIPANKIGDIKNNANLIIVDSKLFPKEKLQTLVFSLPDVPVLIVVPDAAKLKSLSSLATGRREVIVEDEVERPSVIRTIHHLAERQQLHEQLQKTAYRLKEISIRDELTHLYNHQHFTEILSQEVRKAARYRRSLGLILMDLKNFSAINEKLGHHEGDRMLVRTAEIIKATIREFDIAARFGDNSFAVILPETDLASSLCAGERLKTAISDPKTSSISVGIAAMGEDTNTGDELLRAALAALAVSKKDGTVCTNKDLKSEKPRLAGDEHLIGQLNEQIIAAGKEAIKSAFQNVLKIVGIVPFYKKYLVPHAERVAFFAGRLAAENNLQIEEVNMIQRAGLIHDIGKLAIDGEILNKKDKLTHEEMELLHQHSAFGAKMVDNTSFLLGEAKCVFSHHERFDGNGYPDGIKGSDIPLGARIIAITEAWDVMTSKQPYREKPLSLDEALLEIKKGAGSQFDPELVGLFTALITS